MSPEQDNSVQSVNYREEHFFKKLYFAYWQKVKEKLNVFSCLEPHTNFSVDLHVEDILRSRTGELQRAGVFKSEVTCAALLFGVNGHTHTAVRLRDRISDDDDGVWIGGHRQRSAAWIKMWCIIRTVSREVTFYTFYSFLFMLSNRSTCENSTSIIFVFG